MTEYGVHVLGRIPGFKTEDTEELDVAGADANKDRSSYMGSEMRKKSIVDINNNGPKSANLTEPMSRSGLT